MKKLFTWLTKGSKILEIFTYLYRGLAVATRSMEAAIRALKEVQPDIGHDVFPTLEAILKYLNVALEAVKKVLDWFNVKISIENPENGSERGLADDLQTLEFISNELKSKLD